jgi:hypothetical protein
LHKGAISLESREGEGSCFTLRLPGDSPGLRGARSSEDGNASFAAHRQALADAG